MDKISVLILTEYRDSYLAPNDFSMSFDYDIDDEKPNPFDIVFLDRDISEDELNDLLKVCQVHRVFITERLKNQDIKDNIMQLMCAKTISSSGINHFIETNGKYFFKKPYGEKFSLDKMGVSRNFTGTVIANGNNCLSLSGDFGEDYSQAVFFRNNIPIARGQEIDFWIEYSTEGNVEVSIEFTAFLSGSVSTIVDRTEFKGYMLNDIITYGNFDAPVNIFISIKAKGSGTLNFIALHDRFSRGMNGAFLIGGERYVTKSREEIFAYFEPGDLKPPLNVYFSGYKTREGFEGYNMLKGLGCPFLLIAEARLEGGAFYIGDWEYEETILNIIGYYMGMLGFTEKDVILSGLSMGSYGALYYSADLGPHAVIVGKPLASLGDIASNEKRFRPGQFPTSLDVLKKNTSLSSTDAVSDINSRFWKKYERADWSNTELVVAYMIEDDYDAKAYQNMISKIKTPGAIVYGKGIHGRHNDNTGGIVSWFMGQFEAIIKKDFPREERDKQ